MKEVGPQKQREEKSELVMYGSILVKCVLHSNTQILTTACLIY